MAHLATVPPRILIAAVDTISKAWEAYDTIQGNKKDCKHLIRRCEVLLGDLADLISGEHSSHVVDNITSVENACLSVKHVVDKIKSRGRFARILHRNEIAEAIKIAETKLADALVLFNLKAHIEGQQLQAEIAAEIKREIATLEDKLNSIVSGERKYILDAVHGNHQRVEELFVPLTNYLEERQTVPAQTKLKPEEEEIKATPAPPAMQKPKPPAKVPAWKITNTDITIDREAEDSFIGRGSSGTTYKGDWHGQVVAVKEVRLDEGAATGNKTLKSFKKEIAIWSRLNHPRIAPFYGACIDNFQTFIVMKYFENGNVQGYLLRHSRASRLQLLYEISLGMGYLHKHSVIHGNLKAANILIGDDEQALITDFGASQTKTKTETQNDDAKQTKSAPLNTSLRWTAPEIISGEALSTTADVYSFGMISWEIYTGCVPFPDLHDDEIDEEGIRDKLDDRPDLGPMSVGLQNLVRSCWDHSPSKRPKFTGSSNVSSLLRGIVLEVKTSSTNAITGQHSLKRKREVSSEVMSAELERTRPADLQQWGWAKAIVKFCRIRI